jgi:hypothetical protein
MTIKLILVLASAKLFNANGTDRRSPAQDKRAKKNDASA